MTPLMCAAFGNHCECIKLLLAAGADRSVATTVNSGDSIRQLLAAEKAAKDAVGADRSVATTANSGEFDKADDVLARAEAVSRHLVLADSHIMREYPPCRANARPLPHSTHITHTASSTSSP